MEQAHKIAEYSKTEAALAELRLKYQNATFDVTVASGMKDARVARATLRTLRTGLEAKRTEIKAPILKQGALIDSEAKRITRELLALEDPIDTQIRTEERRVEDLRLAAERAEAERLDAIERERKAAEARALAEEKARLAAAQKRLDEERAQLEADQKAARGRAEAESASRADAALKVAKALDDAARESRERIAAEEEAARQRRDAADKQAREKQEQTSAAMSEITGLQQQAIIAQVGRLGVRAGGTLECARETLKETEDWPITEERFGIFHGAAVKAKEQAIASIRQTIAAAEQREAAEAKEREARREAEELAAAQRREQVAREESMAAAGRERARDKAERADARQMLVLFIERHGGRPEFGYVVVAMRDYLDKNPE